MSNQFKPETSALVLIDYQVGTLQLSHLTIQYHEQQGKCDERN